MIGDNKFVLFLFQYVNGRIHDIRTIATGQDDYGVYPGCGSACVILNRPCNYGSCIDEYDSFKCNCSVSPFDGKFCQNGMIYFPTSP